MPVHIVAHAHTTRTLLPPRAHAAALHPYAVDVSARGWRRGRFQSAAWRSCARTASPMPTPRARSPPASRAPSPTPFLPTTPRTPPARVPGAARVQPRAARTVDATVATPRIARGTAVGPASARAHSPPASRARRRLGCVGRGRLHIARAPDSGFVSPESALTNPVLASWGPPSAARTAAIATHLHAAPTRPAVATRASWAVGAVVVVFNPRRGVRVRAVPAHLRLPPVRSRTVARRPTCTPPASRRAHALSHLRTTQTALAVVPCRELARTSPPFAPPSTPPLT
ncbi:hypothetical protein B0H16DRAFT_1721070 [Mycena metata]|uniref:Uncharacterized protein n=1 Tax=Mycena metata TaxID=1033252 RepID=A0AAD7J7J9_9AGAR|nr:hypothetical protein B0H16DRAFT_1721070 [Mycena metata]